MLKKGEHGKEEAGEQDAKSGRGRKKKEDGWRGNRERTRCAQPQGDAETGSGREKKRPRRRATRP